MLRSHKAPIFGYACGTPTPVSLYWSGSARNSMGLSAMWPKILLNRSMHADLWIMWLASADNISVFVHSGHLNFFRGVTWKFKMGNVSLLSWERAICESPGRGQVSGYTGSNQVRCNKISCYPQHTVLVKFRQGIGFFLYMLFLVNWAQNPFKIAFGD